MSAPSDNGKSERQEKFVRSLRRLCEQDKVKWAQSESEPGFVHCLVAEEYLMFQLLGPDGELVRPDHKTILGITCHFGNVTYLWVPGSTDWDVVRHLLQQSPVDDEAVDSFQRVAQKLQTRLLERMIELED